MLILMSLALLAVASQEAKAPVPPEAALAPIEKTVRDVFKEDYLKRTPAAQQALARKLIQQGIETKTDPGSRYVLFREGADLAARAGDLPTLLQAVDEILKSFQTTPVVVKPPLLLKIEPNLTKPEDLKLLAEAYLKVADEAVELDQYEVAAKAAQSSVAVAKKSKDAPVMTRAEVKAKVTLEAKAAFDRASKAEKALAENAGDPSANLAWGQFLCLFKGDWEKGLPFLSKGSDAALKLLAAKDLDHPSDAARQVEIADGWWDLSEKESGRAKANAYQRATYWYGEALPKLTGLSKLKAEKRLIGASAGKEDSAKASGTSGDAKLLIRNNGDEVIQLFVERTKKWQPYKNLNPQESLEVLTFAGTRWEAREGDRSIRFDVPSGGAVWDILTDKRTSSPKGVVPLVKFNVVNRRSSTLAILWVDFDGKLKSYGELAANGTRDTSSFEGHRWEAHENGKVVSKFAIPVGGGTWEIR